MSDQETLTARDMITNSGIGRSNDLAIQDLYSRQRVSNPANLAGDSSAPSPPSMVDSATSGSETISFSFMAVQEDRLNGFSIYRSMDSSSNSATRIGVLPAPTSFGSPVSFTDRPPVGGTYYYWVASSNAGGAESPRSGMGFATVSDPSIQATLPDAATYPGATWDAKVRNALAALPVPGGGRC